MRRRTVRSQGALVAVAVVLAAVLTHDRPRAQTPATAQAAAAPALTGTAVVVGRIIDAIDNTPLAGAIVTLAAGRTPPRRVLVDGQGRFMFLEVPAGSFTLSATRARYLDGAFGRTRPDGDGRTLDLRDGERVTDAVIKMWRPAVISGTVTDDAGDPVAARVLILRRTMVAGRSRFVAVGSPLASDDRGIYRTPPLRPGDYVAATTSSVTSVPATVVAEVDAIRRAGGTAADDFTRKVINSGAASPLFDLLQGRQMTRKGDMFVDVGGPAMPTAAIDASMNLYSTVWSPSVTAPAQATVVTVGPGDDRSGVDLHLTLSRTFRVSGTVTGAEGPVASLGLRLLPAGLDDVANETPFFAAITATAADGSFTFMGVHPGQYVVRGATWNRPAEGSTVSRDPMLWVATPVVVGEADVSGVTAAAHAGVRVDGRVEFEGSSPKPSANDLRAFTVTVEPIDGRAPSFGVTYAAQVDASGVFYTSGLPAGRYFIRATGSAGSWTLKSAIVNGRDVADVPLALDSVDVNGLVLTLTDHPSGLAGTVRSPQGSADPDATVIVFPPDPPSWRDVGTSPRRVRSVRASRSGSYLISNLPPGDYCVIAVNDASPGNWQDPARLQELARTAARVTVVDGQRASFDLTTVVR